MITSKGAFKFKFKRGDIIANPYGIDGKQPEIRIVVHTKTWHKHTDWKDFHSHAYIMSDGTSLDADSVDALMGRWKKIGIIPKEYLPSFPWKLK